MSRGLKTIEQLARSLGTDTQNISQLAKKVLKLESKRARDPNHKLDPNQCDKIKSALSFSITKSKEPPPVSPPPTPVLPEQALQVQKDPPAIITNLEFRNLAHRLYVHQDVSDYLKDIEPLRKRLSLVLQHLGAHGRTSVVKGCADDKNRGWLRSPLGGHGGKQFYLWWTKQGNHPVKTLDFPKNSIVVRAVRHHDNHTLLTADQKGDYFNYTQQMLEDNSYAGSPWTEDQLKFIGNDSPVRVILGRPGSGKTTALWKAVEARDNQRVLYLTWSRELTDYAIEHFKAFAPVNVKVEGRDFDTFLGEVCKEDIKRAFLLESQERFRDSVKRLGPHLMGPWADRPNALFAEIRAYLLGRAIPGDPNCVPTGGTVRLSDKVYLERRGSKEGVGKHAADALIKIFHAIEQDAPLQKLFPELIAAARAVDLLRRDNIPAGYKEFDRIVIDEVQDLTLLEASVAIELCRAIAHHRKYAPWLLIAGDDGQTVRPSGFEWGPLKDLITRCVAPPEKFQLEDNLRCPRRIADVIERASERYSHLPKKRRPTNQRHQPGGQHMEAFLFYVEAKKRQEAVDLLEGLANVEGLRIISPHDELPAWIPEDSKDIVWTPADIKGLEYQSVCVLDPGHLLAQLESSNSDGTTLELEEQDRRTTIDQFRVALSRATEKLAFLDVESNDRERALSLELLEDAARYAPEDLVEEFHDADASTTDRVLVRTKDAMALVDNRPGRAWQRAYQALVLLGNPNLPNGVSEESVRREAYLTLLTIAARLLVDGVPKECSRNDVVVAAQASARSLHSEAAIRVFEQLEAWTSDRSSSATGLLEAIASLPEDSAWAKTSLSSAVQALRQSIESASLNAATAADFAGNVQEWLRLTGYAGEAFPESLRLRRQAFDVLLKAGKLQSAELLLDKIQPEDAPRTGQLREAQSRYKDAAEAFERAGATIDALRNWRAAGVWEKAVKLSDGGERKDLQWLIELQEHVGKRPAEHGQRMTPAERRRLKAMLNPHL